MNLEAVEIEVNAKAIVDLIANDNSSNWFISFLIDDCRILASQIPHKKIGHCFREASKCADAPPIGVVDTPPIGVVDVFNSDLFKLYSNRFCLGSFVVV